MKQMDCLLNQLKKLLPVFVMSFMGCAWQQNIEIKPPANANISRSITDFTPEQRQSYQKMQSYQKSQKAVDEQQRLDYLKNDPSMIVNPKP